MKNLYFRGRRIIDESLKALSTQFGLAEADNVLLFWLQRRRSRDVFAHGLRPNAARVEVGEVHDEVQGLLYLRLLPAARDNVEGKPVYATQMENIFNLANSTHGVNDACIASLPVDKQWQCNFAQHAYAHTEAPIFPLNSALDSWQAGVGRRRCYVLLAGFVGTRRNCLVA